MACILAVVVARPFINEMPFRWPNVVFAEGLSDKAQKPPDELIRVTFAMILLAAACLWAAAQVPRRRLRVAAPALGLMILIFGALSLVSALSAADRRSAVDGWLEQVSILLAGFVVIQLARENRRRGLVIVVLAALAVTMAWRSLDEVFSAIPQRIEEFQQNRRKVFRIEGVDPSSPKARMMAKRIRDRSATGYLGLANVFASLLVVLAAAGAGLAIDKFAAARAGRGTRPPAAPKPAGTPLARREIHLPTLAAVVGIALSVLPAVGLLLTRSKGGIAAGALAALAGGVVAARPSFFARHRRKLLGACAAAAVGAILAVATYGAATGGLPGRSMQVRWEYWAGAGGLIREHPLRGVGPANFGDAYLKHRLPAAAESTKTAHNVLVDAACAYGLPGAAAYVGVLVCLILAVTRPARASSRPAGAGPPGKNSTMVLGCVFLAAAVLAIRATWAGTTRPSGFFMEAIFPAIIFGVALLGLMWAGRTLGAAETTGRFARIVLGAGLIGFVLHNLITFTLFSPATATVFWIAAGAMMGPAVSARQVRRGRTLAALLTVAAGAGLLAAGLCVWRPVRRRTSYIRLAQSAYSHRRLRPTITNLEAAVAADRLDGFAPGYLASICLATARVNSQAVSQMWADKAVQFAELAWKRTPTSLHAMLLARALWVQARNPARALEMAERAVGMDPMNVRLRWEYARMLPPAGKFDAAMQQLQQARRIDLSRAADSDLRLTTGELKAINLLERKIRQSRP